MRKSSILMRATLLSVSLFFIFSCSNGGSSSSDYEDPRYVTFAENFASMFPVSEIKRVNKPLEVRHLAEKSSPLDDNTRILNIFQEDELREVLCGKVFSSTLTTGRKLNIWVEKIDITHAFDWAEHPYAYIFDADHSSEKYMDTLQKIKDIFKKFDELYSMVTYMYGEPVAKFLREENDSPVIVSDMLDDSINLVLTNMGDCGYFWSPDFFIDYKGSNKGIFLYINDVLYDEDGNLTIAHEFSHLCNFCKKIIKNECENDNAAWWTEMCAMTMEDMIHQHAEAPLEKIPFMMIKSEFIKYSKTDIPAIPGVWYDNKCIEDKGEDYFLASYASSYMFGAFLIRNYGVEFFREMANNDGSTSIKDGDCPCITMALQKTGAKEETFADAYKKFAECLLNSNAHNSKASFNKEISYKSYNIPSLNWKWSLIGIDEYTAKFTAKGKQNTLFKISKKRPTILDDVKYDFSVDAK